ncbi:helix-turn-helix domain-containing protein [Companilactobacillus ginsenosidimutans]|uniref:helix-turn-helix domain-containing protein n=1 Tax=Companilactobacillus ginsenosidimutans TaxID=1007676 RepID=UPI0007DC31B6|nr:helix-turn-helix transcriptional regulator [Companilactobacillus ginsenosidimutans]
MRFGERLKQARKESGITQQQLSNKLNLSRQTISSWETGNSYPDIESLIQLSNYFDISLDVLIKDDTNVSDALSRNDISKRLRLFIILLTVVNLMFFVVRIINSVGSLHVSDEMIISAFVIFNSAVLIMASIFQMNLMKMNFKWLSNKNLGIAILVFVILNCKINPNT